ncbi:hypothetical protein D7322_27360 [Sphingobacterium puteale]|uniref:Uncharacterized protein n=1 Tax=Sphingobacterium puteale TaxID=2420510 RepID=A0A420VQ01_9SPHI|nr:hypothetical protein [Sphingobacterium puteale]RKO68399.1 hypothetical protein D7322_27360 [Sphingobacterium puteale]
MNELDDFTIGLHSGGQSISIKVIGLLVIDATSNWDKNWLRTKISVRAGAFSGIYDADLTTFDIENFEQDLNSLYENLNSEIEFKDLEGYLYMKIKGNGQGNINAEISCSDDTGINAATLNFELNFDQTYIKPVIQKLKNITNKYPVVY